MLNWVKQAVIETAGTDDTKYPTLKVKYKGKTSDCLPFTPFGLYTNPPKGSGGLVFTPSGIESNLWGIFQDFESRFKDLKEGEAIIGSPIYLNTIEFKEDGSVNILTEEGTLNLSSDGTLTLTNGAGSTVFNADGSVAFANGATIDATGDYISATGISLNLHKHVGNLGAPTGPAIP